MEAAVRTEVVLEAHDLERVYRVGDMQVRALQGASLTIRRGEFVAIMGSSGSGKSTLMSILGCLDRPTGGRYVFEGLEVAALSEPELAGIRSERLGFVFQSFNLLPRTSALENVALPLVYARSGPRSDKERLARARAALTLLGLSDREANTPGQLSGGQQQRVAIARALINGPSLLLADEPTGNLDSKTSHEIMQTLSTLNRDQGLTIVLVTHEPDIAAYAQLQFLAEAVLLSVTGGGLGILAGLAASLIIAATTGWPVPISPAALVGGFLFSAAVGVFFGFYPARKASRLDPIEALRFE